MSDSGTITEESSLLNFPAINLRETHERPEGNEESSVMFSSFDLNKLEQVIDILKSQKRGIKRTLEVVKDYETSNVSEKIIRIILSYTEFVNKRTWKKF